MKVEEESDDNPLQYLISLPLSFVFIPLLLFEKSIIKDENILWCVGLLTFVSCIIAAFYFSDILINKLLHNKLLNKHGPDRNFTSNNI